MPLTFYDEEKQQTVKQNQGELYRISEPVWFSLNFMMKAAV